VFVGVLKGYEEIKSVKEIWQRKVIAFPQDVLPLNKLGTVNGGGSMPYFNPDSHRISVTVEDPKWSPVANGFFPPLMVKIRMVHVVHSSVLMKILLSHIEPLLSDCFAFNYKPSTEKVFHRFREVLFFAELVVSFKYRSLALLVIKFK
jgi:hypothetical protein